MKPYLAHHLAGHLAAFHALSGYFMKAPPGNPEDLMKGWKRGDGPRKGWARKYALCYLAGMAAVERLTEAPPNMKLERNKVDWIAARKLVSKYISKGLTVRTKRRMMQQLYEESQALVKKHWHLIQRFARLIMRRDRQLVFEEFRDTLEAK